MNIIEKTDEEILELAHPMWADLIKYSNEGNYGAFTRNFSSSFIAGANEVEMGKQFARSDLAKNLSEDYPYLGMIRRGEYVTVLYKVINKKNNSEWLGRLVLGYEDKARIFWRYAVLENFIYQDAPVMSDTIEDEKFVELNYKVIDNKTGDVLVTVDYPLAYVHGVNDVMSEDVTKELYGKKVGDIIEVAIDTAKLYGERDESLVFTDRIENVPEEYREIGMTITMENDKGEPKDFIVTRFDDKTLTVDGNNPLCGREVTFMLEVLSIREATEEEIDLGGAVGADPELNEILDRAK